MKKLILKHSLIAAAALGAVSMAQAQTNVTLYGRVDLGIQHSTKTIGTAPGALPTVNAGSKTELFNGGILPSIWGLRGTEDLGSGLSAFFNLESHISADTGAGVGGLFRRQANVGLKGGWGAVALGRQYSPAILAHLGTDPRGFKEQLSMLYPYAFNQTTIGGPGAINDLGVFLGNAVSYTNSFGPVNVGVAYSLGEVAGNNGAGKTLAVGGSYTGPVTVSASYQQISNLADTGDSKQFGVGAAAPLGPVKLKALFLNTKSDTGVLVGGRETNVNTWGVGADYAWGANTTTLAYYQGKDKDAADDKTKTLVLSNDYALSKRTTLYAQVAYADANTGASARTAISLAQPVAGTKSTIFGLGVKHDF